MPPVYKLLPAVAFGLLLAGCLADGEAEPEAGGSPLTTAETEASPDDAETGSTDDPDAGRVPEGPADPVVVAAGEAEPDRARRLILPPELLGEPENAPLRRLPPDVGVERAAIDGYLAIPDRLRVGPEEAPAAEDAAVDDVATAATTDDGAEADGIGRDGDPTVSGADADDGGAIPAAGILGGGGDADAADSPPPLLEPAAAAGVQVWAPSQRVRQGPWHVVCYQDNQVVFEHDAIYRVWRADHNPPQWAYETIDGVRFRGRIGTDVNCTWQRL